MKQCPFLWTWVGSLWPMTSYDITSLSPSDIMWRHRSESTVAQVMAWYRQAPSHYLNQCRFLISEVQWHSSESNFRASTPVSIQHNESETKTFKIIATYPQYHWVTEICHNCLWHTYYMLYRHKSVQNVLNLFINLVMDFINIVKIIKLYVSINSLRTSKFHGNKSRKINKCYHVNTIHI